MRRDTILLIITTCMVTCDIHTRNKSGKNLGNEVSSRQKRMTDDTQFALSSSPNSSSVFPNTDPETEQHRHRRRRRRCRRAIESYYRVPNYQINYNAQYQVPPKYIPYEYVLPSPYVPTRCSNFCRVCPLPNCSRRCPDYRVSTSSTTRTTPRTRSTTSSRTTTRRSSVPTIKACSCDPNGAKSPRCDMKTGVCVCNPHYTGKNCSNCQDGYWKQLRNCVECRCNQRGSLANTYCDRNTGRCHCKPGVTGTFCDSCLPGHYGTVQTGCKRCDRCDRTGHICDPTNGKCVCPTLTTGNDCERCVERAWGYDPAIGCKACNCSMAGSSDVQCDQTRGICTCKIGYEGIKCDRCSHGYYGYPNCRKCSCDPKGTEEGYCRNGLCACNGDGSCRCKENVQGKNCDRCKKNTYGMTKENPKGCNDCFCFGRSNQCQDSQYRWDKITGGNRSLENNNQVYEDDLMLPTNFMGDRTSSYGGKLVVIVDGGYFDVFLEGNSVQLHSLNNFHEIQLAESKNWRVVSRNPEFPNSCIDRLTRSCFMVVLQKVTSIVVKANRRIEVVSLDKAEDAKSGYPVSHAVEKCQCPDKYTGLSCQDPSRGYYRYFPRDSGSSWIDRVVGTAKECECRGHSSECDPETGLCKNCDQHRTGDYCDKCEEGYYKNKNKTCVACLCPSINQNNAKSCSPTANSFKCECKEGYSGNFCEKCDRNFYKKRNSTVCQPCRCNRFGIIPGDSGSCNDLGECVCKDGFMGAKCDQCVGDRKYVRNGICEPCDECTMKLFNDIDEMKRDVDDVFELFKNGTGPPWRNLTEKIENLDGLSDKYFKRKERVDDLLKNANLTGYKAKVAQMEKKLVEDNIEAKKILIKSEQLFENSTRLLEKSEDLAKEFVTLIKTLESSGTTQIPLEDALARAQSILKSIENASKKFTAYSNNTLSFCGRVTEKVNTLYQPLPDLPENKLVELKNKLQDLVDIVSFVENLSKLADAKNAENSKRIGAIKGKIEILKGKNEDYRNTVGDIIEKSSAIEDMMDKLVIVYDDLKEISDFEEFKDVESRVRRQMKEIPEIEQVYSRAVQHVRELESKVNDYQKLFNFTKDEWKKINASGAYEAIITGIEKSKASMEQSKQILKDSIMLIDPESTDSLNTKANLAQAYSDRLKQKTSDLKNISKNLARIRNNLAELEYGLLENGKANNNLTQIIHRIGDEITSQSGKVGDLEKARNNLANLSEEMKRISEQVESMSVDKLSNLMKKYQNDVKLAVPKEITDIIGNLSTTTRKLKVLNVLPTEGGSEKNRERTNRLENLRETMKTLQGKIKSAKQQVDVIDVAMSVNNCQMYYRLSESQFFQSLSITFKCRNCVLFKWSKPDEEVLELVVENETVKLWARGKEIQMPVNITMETTVNLEKVGPFLKLQIDDVERTERVVGMSVINTEDVLEIGSLDSSITSNNDSYIAKVLLNENEFGLWKFINTSGSCRGVKGNATTVENNKRNFFNGKGYREYGINYSLNPKKLALKFHFNTFDDNATIYLAVHNTTCSYIALFLENGLMKLAIKHSNGDEVLLPNPHKVNDAKQHDVEIGTTYNDGTQTYRLVVDQQEPIHVEKKLNRRHVFKIKEAKHYLGGVPPTFNKTCVPINSTSLLGFLRQTSQQNELTNETISYGITTRDSIDFSFAWIQEKGEMNISVALGIIRSIRFIVRPTSPNGVMIRFINDSGHNYTISLSDLKLVVNDVKYNGTNITLNEYNSVELKMDIEGGKITVNGETEFLEYPGKITAHLIQIGGADGDFSGGIRDIVINGQLLSFNATSVKHFSNVKIGRERPLPKSNPNVKSLSIRKLTNLMQNTERCVDFESFESLSNAVKLGDTSSSFVHIKTNFWRRNSTLQFAFRTFDPNGLIFISSNKRLNFISLVLIDGQLLLNIKKGKKRVKSRRVPSDQLNDGNWHTIRLTKKAKKLTISLDDTESKTNFRLKLRDEIYFGGVPSSSEYTKLTQGLHPFRGCLKSLRINDEQKFLPKVGKDVTHSDVGRCFANVEEGAYFGGDSFAIFRNDFQTGEMLELAFQFRTSEQNGILLSVSNPGDFPALSIELQNGAIVMAVNIGNGMVSNVTNNLDSDFSLCNNRWHNVTALYSTSELTVNVDGIRKSWVLSNVDSTMDEMEAPLYVGGLPDGAPEGTSKSHRNFKGCIKKLRVQTKLVDWSEMKQLNKIMLNSCPTDHS